MCGWTPRRRTAGALRGNVSGGRKRYGNTLERLSGTIQGRLERVRRFRTIWRPTLRPYAVFRRSVERAGWRVELALVTCWYGSDTRRHNMCPSGSFYVAQPYDALYWTAAATT